MDIPEEIINSVTASVLFAAARESDRPKHENQADRFAALNLICADELADLYKWCPDEQRVVQELGVTTRLFRAYLLTQQPAA